MNRTVLSCLAAITLAGGVSLAIGATAQAEDCYGTRAARVCVTPDWNNVPSVDPSSSSIDECVYTGPSCTPVSVPVPGVSVAPSPFVDVNCYVDIVGGFGSCHDPFPPD